MRAFITVCFLLVASTALAERPYQTVHTSKVDDSARIEAQGNQYFSGQFSSQNDIVMTPPPSDEDDGGRDD